jgi:hypothetical protein
MKNPESNQEQQNAEDFDTIISIQHADSDSDDFDYDFDYDPNEMYYALNSENNL